MPEETPVPATLEALEGLVEEQRFEQASDLIKSANPADAADALQGLDPDDIARVLGAQETGHTADVLEELPDDIAAKTLVHFPVEQAAKVVRELISDEEADILQELPEEQREAIIGSLDEEQQALAREMLSYPEDTAGGLMQKEFVEVPLRARAGEAVAMLQARAEEIANYPAAYLYVTDNDGVLKGILNLRALLFSAPETRVVSIMTKTPVTVSVEMPGEELYDLFRRHRYLALPVVDRHGVLRGVVTKDDAMQFEIESGEEEFLRFSGIAGGEEVRDMPT
ncbi:MAG: CBS domain-containing protein, partial [Nitrospirae bacterium]|nr:CBS domain-containing protein [Fimbriimonadaceae bacterium]